MKIESGWSVSDCLIKENAETYKTDRQNKENAETDKTGRQNKANAETDQTNCQNKENAETDKTDCQNKENAELLPRLQFDLPQISNRFLAQEKVRKMR